jgi:aspartate/methionine/tyrosine aminotransferase
MMSKAPNNPPATWDASDSTPAANVELALREALFKRSGTVLSRERIPNARAAGVDVIPLKASIQEPLALHVVEAIIRGASKHTVSPIRGLAELRSAISEKLRRENGIEADPESEIIVTNGAKQALHIGLSAILEPGDEVVFPTPAYVFSGSIALAGGVPRPAPMSELDAYSWDRDRLAACITTKTKALLLNTPANPTGYVATRDEAQTAVDLAVARDLMLLVDQSHERLTYGGREHVSPATLPGAKGRTLTVFSMTKAHNLQGLRIGYLVGPSHILDRAVSLLEWAILTSNYLSQVAAHAVLTGPQDWLETLIQRCQDNAYAIADVIDATSGIEAVRPKGGAHHYVNVRQLGLTGEEVSHRLLFEHGVPTDPGTVFGDDDHIRIGAVASEPRNVAEALERLKTAIRSMSGRG